MPNTLAHIAINGVITKTVIRSSNLLWIYLGCLIPDIPWILRRIILLILPSINGNDLQSYLIAQASLFFSLFLCFIFALISKETFRTFLILSLGSLLHLLVDALQIKWANGVHIFAPFSWELFYYGIIWPDNIFNYVLTVLGLFYFIFYFKEVITQKIHLDFSRKKMIIVSLALFIYAFGPFLFLDKIFESDCHYVNTLSNYENRVGKYVEFDRKKVIFDEKTKSYWIDTFDNNKIELSNVEKLKSDNISVKGKFVSENSLFVEEYHENLELFRDGASYLGILLIFLIWLRNLFLSIKMRITSKSV